MLRAKRAAAPRAPRPQLWLLWRAGQREGSLTRVATPSARHTISRLTDFFSYGLAVAAAFARGAAYVEPAQEKNERYLRGVASIMLWFRLLEILSLNLYTGPLLSMVFSMIRRDIGRYVILQLFVVLSFAAFFSAVFPMVPEDPALPASYLATAPPAPEVDTSSPGPWLAVSTFGSMRVAVQHLIELTLAIGDPGSGGMWAAIEASDAKVLGAI